MAGAKSYKREDLLDRAIELFRRQGYAGTSTAELVEELGVNRKSMYAEFGSKQDLFEAALERYSAVNLTRVLAPIEDPTANVASIKSAFDSYASGIDGKFNGLGCLMANTAVERAALDPGSAKFVDAYLSRLQAGFRQALENGKDQDAVNPAADLDALASYFAMSVVGVSAMIRAKAPSRMVHDACREIVGRLDS
ncbi:MAG: TetR/AcrR family transcriptional regulator [Cognatishimia activa]